MVREALGRLPHQLTDLGRAARMQIVKMATWGGDMASQFIPVLVVLAFAVALAVGLMGFAALVGQRSRTVSNLKGESYESGVPTLDRAHKRISVAFFIVALLFVVLDVEVAFLYPWAVNYRQLLSEQSLVVYLDMLAFVLLLAFVYVYLWKQGVFDWGRKKPSAAPDAGETR